MMKPRKTIFTPPLKRAVLLIAVLGVLTVWGSTVGEFLGARAMAETPPHSPVAIADFIQENCIACHDSGTTEGDLDLEALAMELGDADNFHSWERIYDRVLGDASAEKVRLDWWRLRRDEERTN